MTARSHWNGVRMRTVEAAADPDDAPRSVTLPADWDDTAAEALARLTPGHGPASLPDEAAHWIDDLCMDGTAGPAVRPVARALSCLLLMRQAAPTQDLWHGHHDRRPGFVVNLAAFVEADNSFMARDFVAALRLLARMLRMIAQYRQPLCNGELPLPDPTQRTASHLRAVLPAMPPQPPCVAGSLLLTNLDACLAGLGFDYDSESGRDAACSIVALATLVAHAGEGADAMPLPPVRSILPGVSQIARNVWQEAAVEIDQPAARVETGFSTSGPIDALLGVEACGLAPVFSPLRPDGRLATSTLARLACRGLTLEAAFAATLAGESVLPLPSAASHQAMHRALSGFVDRAPPRPDATRDVLATRAGLERGVRRPLPARHGGFTQKASVGGHRLFLRTGEYADGALGEISLTPTRESPMVRGLMDTLGQAVSIGLQYGVPLESYVEAFAYTQFGPAGTVEGDPVASYATSMLDYAFRALSDAYLGRRLPDAPHEEIMADSPAPMLPLDLPGSGNDDGDDTPPRRRRLRLVG
ncbi:vitamin B12-dependent ribonucleotide reductase [Komagataeibacter medellinensis]|uniref:ribonucleoside-diphosphate reductase n=1 Tax=Komagataeibacter medellinensis TaxID=1177712 RepID=A0ABQ6VVM0_9PROT|nr:vitamin B12-dependent ribonucleotide reductase [Komagataeibacter medellinensis]KAB8124237.1 vitamin B12-dependent ribonucleotide reductase [Komagataeibacter medellinensis]